jgi:hypothetical protein
LYCEANKQIDLNDCDVRVEIDSRGRIFAYLNGVVHRQDALRNACLSCSQIDMFKIQGIKENVQQCTQYHLILLQTKRQSDLLKVIMPIMAAIKSEANLDIEVTDIHRVTFLVNEKLDSVKEKVGRFQNKYPELFAKGVGHKPLKTQMSTYCPLRQTRVDSTVAASVRASKRVSQGASTIVLKS